MKVLLIKTEKKYKSPTLNHTLYGYQDINIKYLTPAGADASMKIYSMIETAKANELDPLKYLSFLLEHRPGAEMSDEELEQFAPWSKLAQETCK